MTGLQNLSAQVVCHTPGTISVNLGPTGSHLVDGTEVVISTNGANISNVVLRLDGMNGPITSNPVTCALLLGGPRTIWVMVETDDGNNCMTSFILQDKLGPDIECPSVFLECDDEFSDAPDATATDNCSTPANINLVMNQALESSISGFDGAFNPASITSDEIIANGESVEINGANTELTIVGSTTPFVPGNPCIPMIDGPMCEVVNVCVTIPVSGTVSFDWVNELAPGSTGHFPSADPTGYSIDGIYTTLSTGGTDNGSEVVPVNAGEVFCFATGSNGSTANSQSVFSNLVYDFDPADPCTNDYIIKRWTATDEYGNSTECRQFIVKVITDDITCPDSLLTSLGTAINCTDFNDPSFEKDMNGHPAVSETGAPTGCNINYTYQDVVITGCTAPATGGCLKINRTFHIVNSCTGEKTTCVQQIEIEDRFGPDVSGLPNNFVVPTDATDCIASYTVPVPVITDSCSTVGMYNIVPSRGNLSFNGTNYVISNLTPGPFSYTLQVRDCCGNLTTETRNGDVQDLAPPTPVCVTFHDVTLTTNGTGRVFANTFNGGSNDNCNPVFFKVIRMNPSDCAIENGDDDPSPGNQVWFDDDVYFCCEDVAVGLDSVILRVFDVNPGVGPVLPSRMEPGGDLFGRFNDCMVNVRVFDKVAPTLTCPTSVTVSCEFWFDIDDLDTHFGTVVAAPTAPGTTTTLDPGTLMNVVVTDGVASGNCVLSPQVDTVIDMRNSCGVGNIIRRFEVGTGLQRRTCDQVITVQDATPFNLSNITWPAATVDFSTCNPDTDTSATGVPIITGDGVCAQISTTFSDTLFPIHIPSCFKIKRVWKIKDICQHNASDPTQGVWTFEQTISVKNTTNPTYASCDSISLDCASGTLNLTQTVSDDCTDLADLIIEFKVDLGNDGSFEYIGGNNNPAAGGMILVPSSYDTLTGVITADPILNIPPGEHRVLWVTNDLCSNLGTCTQIITSGNDTAAPVLDIDGIIVSNDNNTVSGMITAVDDCQPSVVYGNYTISLGAGLSLVSGNLMGSGNVISQIEYSGAGDVTVSFNVSDGAGNDTVLVVVNSAMTPPSAMISGAISVDNGDMVQDVHVDAGIGQTDMTDQHGEFEFSPVETGQDYAVTPTKNDDPRNGLSTIDLVLLSRHIIGLQPLTTPYKLIAADVTNDKQIDVFDMVELQRVLIFDIPSFTNNTSWRFVDAGYSFPNPLNPFNVDFPETYDINGLNGDMMGVDFTGIKIGDMNGDAEANAQQIAQNRDVAGTYIFNVADKAVAADGTASIEFSASETTMINGLQMVLDLGQLAVTAIESGMLNIGNQDITLVDGKYVISFANGRPIEVVAGDVLFSLEVATKTATKTATTIATEVQLLNTLLNAEVYTGAEVIEIYNADLAMVSDNPMTDVLFQNRPNPFTQNTTIGFYLVDGGSVRLTIYDLSGKLIYTHDGEFNAGYNQIDLNASDISAEGVLYYQLATDKFTASRRMTVVK